MGLVPGHGGRRHGRPPRPAPGNLLGLLIDALIIFLLTRPATRPSSGFDDRRDRHRRHRGRPHPPCPGAPPLPRARLHQGRAGGGRPPGVGEVAYLAKRWAAKEATSKALGVGFWGSPPRSRSPTCPRAPRGSAHRRAGRLGPPAGRAALAPHLSDTRTPPSPACWSRARRLPAPPARPAAVGPPPPGPPARAAGPSGAGGGGRTVKPLANRGRGRGAGGRGRQQGGIPVEVLMGRAGAAVAAAAGELGRVAGRRWSPWPARGQRRRRPRGLARLARRGPGRRRWSPATRTASTSRATLRGPGPRRRRAGPAFTPELAGRLLAGADLVLDGLLGTGSSGAPRGAVAEAIGCANAATVPVVAVDIPRGWTGPAARSPARAVTAAVTVTFQAVKPGHVLAPGGGAPGGWRWPTSACPWPRGAGG